MKQKRNLLISIFLLTSIVCTAQVVESVEELQKERRPGYSINVPFAKKTTEKALKERMSKENFKGKKSKGAMQYMQIYYPPISDTQVDLYTKVNGDKNTSTIYVFVSKGYENFVTSSSDPVMAYNIKNFVETLAIDVRNYDMQAQIKSQQKDIDKAQKKYDKLAKKQKDLNDDADEALRQLNLKKEEMNKLNSMGMRSY